MSDLGSRRIVLCSKNKGADQLHSHRTADLCLSSHMRKSRFSHDLANIIKVYIRYKAMEQNLKFKIRITY